MTSRAVQYARFGGPEVLELVEREDPVPGEGQVRLAVRAAAVNPLDWKLRSGAMASGDAPPEPRVPGFDVAGVVDAVGVGVTDLAVGDEVLGKAVGGAYAEKALASVRTLVRKPAEVSWEVAAAVPVVATTAYRVLALLGLGEGDHTGTTLVVDGAAGGVGVMAVQVAVARGARVIGTAGEAHQDEVRALGATPVVYGEGLAERVRAVAPQGVDRALDTAGKGALRDLVALTGAPERVVTIADYAGAQELGVTFSSGGDPDEETRALADAVARLADGRLRAPTVVTYPLADAGRAQDDNQHRRVAGKLVLLPT
ncbi:NADP-dependent oxidoreductase [Actinomycetospora cinnamomea]|uniref:NADPH:quinone reductase-like Zn-dependent oxidoreductase n=1 Tax=Actinomycetospora cinnamomea TaxID=663609 RepID=A0A2U1FS16_9PSEU|nr:NADP-dependent oxidoreductase [Actinomycetospora cinnamomea]PVZ14963.1 NADPH:quinone reductase-like Zn-dependent oxidoreductase [Actinomycetospora cinnamomea]